MVRWMDKFAHPPELGSQIFVEFHKLVRVILEFMRNNAPHVSNPLNCLVSFHCDSS